MTMSKPQKLKTRFAPSPTGYLHLGHAYSAYLAYDYARAHNGEFVLRIEDIDQTRCKPEYITAIYDDLRWLGLEWSNDVRIQSEHLEDYIAAMNRLKEIDVIYPCFCSRSDIQKEISESANAPHGPEGPLYPGTCKKLTSEQKQAQIRAGKNYALRLDAKKASDHLKQKNTWPLLWRDAINGPQQVNPETFGDVVLARKDTPTSYHLSVTVDDALQNITHITRGEDLFEATHIHRLLQALLDLPTPLYNHHPLLLDEKGKRFAKRDNAKTLQHLRKNGITVQEVRAMCDLP